MIKILWNQCEVGMELQNMPWQTAAISSVEHRTHTEQCYLVGQERKFADGATALMCEAHWTTCIGIVDKDGVKHMKPDNQAVG